MSAAKTAVNIFVNLGSHMATGVFGIIEKEKQKYEKTNGESNSEVIEALTECQREMAKLFTIEELNEDYNIIKQECDLLVEETRHNTIKDIIEKQTEELSKE